MNPHSKLVVVDEHRNELAPKEIKVQEDAEGVFLITVMLNDADLCGEHAAATIDEPPEPPEIPNEYARR